MRILFVMHNIPYPVISGIRLRTNNLIRRIAMQHEVWLATHICPEDDPADVQALDAFSAHIITATLERRHPLRHLPGLAHYTLRGWPLELKFNHSDDMARALKAISSETSFDIVQIEEPALAVYLEALTPGSWRKSLLTFHDITSSQSQRIAAISSRPLPKLRFWLHGRQMRRWEARYAARFDCCITVSELDRERLLVENPALDVAVVPNGVDTATLQPLPAIHTPTLLFVGSMNYAPCVDAMLFFCRDVLPLIRQRVPDVELWIVGSNPVPEILAFDKDGVHVTGRVPEVVPYYERSAVTVVPLRAGGGTRLKILESLALGRPVVSTTIGSEGLALNDGEHLLNADEPEPFADAVVRLLTDGTLYDHVAQRGRQVVEDRYDWDAIAAGHMAIYENLINEV